MPLPDLLAPTITARRRRAVSPVPAIIRSLDLPMETQEKDNWCWAAVSVSVRKFYGAAGPRSQCEQAQQQFNRPCCADPDSCDQRWIIDPSLFNRSAGAFPFITVQQHIDARLLVTARIAWAEGGTHFVCIDGYSTVGAQELVMVKDSFYGPSTIPYTTLKSAYQDRGTWTDSYRSGP